MFGDRGGCKGERLIDSDKHSFKKTEKVRSRFKMWVAGYTGRDERGSKRKM